MKHVGEQLKMFMTPREIMDRYQPADGDREGAPWPAGRERYYTDRPQNTKGDWNYERPTANVQRSGSGKGLKYSYEPGEESDQQLWDRKLEESKVPQAEFDREFRGMSQPPSLDWDRLGDHPDYPSQHTGHTSTFEAREGSFIGKRMASVDAQRDSYENDSLYSSIEATGVQYPIRLGTTRGTSGKPQVSGGHHRLAAANAINPDQFVPVLHNEGGVNGARSDSGPNSPWGEYR